jgi:hypothetical protein
MNNKRKIRYFLKEKIKAWELVTYSFMSIYTSTSVVTLFSSSLLSVYFLSPIAFIGKLK